MAEVFDPALEDELNKARDYLRDIDDSIKTLTGRPPPESNNRFGGRGGGMGGRGGRGRFFPNRNFQPAAREEPGGMGGGAMLVGRRRTFGQMRGEEENGGLRGGEWGDYGKRPRRSMGGMEPPPYTQEPPPFFEPRPALASHVSLPIQDEKSREEAITEIKGTEKREQSVRNRRMFGVLMGTLSRFKKEERKEHNFKEQEKKQKEVEEKLESEKREVADKLRREKTDLMDKRRQQEEEITRLQRKRIIMQFAEREENHLKQLQKFIQTQAKPPIFYCPAKHTLRTIELQKKTERRLEETIQKKRKELQHKLDTDTILNPGKQSALDEVQLKAGPGAADRASRRGPGRRDRKTSENEEDSDQEEDKHSSAGEASDAEEPAADKKPELETGETGLEEKEAGEIGSDEKEAGEVGSDEKEAGETGLEEKEAGETGLDEVKTGQAGLGNEGEGEESGTATAETAAGVVSVGEGETTQNGEGGDEGEEEESKDKEVRGDEEMSVE